MRSQQTHSRMRPDAEPRRDAEGFGVTPLRVFNTASASCGSREVGVDVPRATSRRQPARRARGTLSADAIVDAAFAVAAQSSVDELSIPLVAKSLVLG